MTSTLSSKISDREVLQLLDQGFLNCTLGLKCLYFSAVTEEEHKITIDLTKKEITLHYFFILLSVSITRMESCCDILLWVLEHENDILDFECLKFCNV